MSDENEGVEFGDESTDDGMTIDFNNVEDQQFELMPRAMYECEVDSLEFGTSQNAGNPMWTWRLSVVEGEFADRKLFFHTVFAGAGLPRTKKCLMRVCPDIVSGKFNPEQVANEGTLLGRRVRAKVDQNRYQGEMRNNVKDIFPSEGGGSEDFI